MMPNTSKAKCMIAAMRALFLLAILAGAAFTQTAVPPPQSFEAFLRQRYSASDPAWSIEKLCPVSESRIAARVLANYGAMFAARDSVVLPNMCVYRSDGEFKTFRERLKTDRVEIASVPVEFQTVAADGLRQALIDAEINGLRITPLDGSIAGGRSFGDTLMLWNSRVFPGLDYWIRVGRLTESDRDELARLDLDKKIEKILEWESRGIFFSTDKSRSIMTSTAPPGASQHLAFVAFDIVEYWNPRTRKILNGNGWYQTIVDDPPHFTYLGVPETQLPARGLRPVTKGGFQFWIPNLETPNLNR